ncbi:LysE family transporter [Shewanella baltica]|uniref:LysE family transporter n=1 Tax=Shewanella baltica TaxID=62322 RepID=UPI00014F81BC|nr:LysE family transporter [Shewanella baltica]ABS06826.1 Lysine exporter protein (LYSE/YGGA) [Shewanella baltica OS185]MCS6129297.1 LysE family transporter [Shewanella baltica]MCS6141189.1 LysE family transporter [Shewanella baltica]MCS6147473.1 LysE family transporter [Shewanella baltica]MCS6172002.1 LysE family transporter [Shewanella baltica]
MDLSLLLTLAVIHSVALISPGPDFAIMVKIATQQSRSTAIAAAVGISIAILAHTILSLTGVSLLIKSSHTLYLLVQIVGASYLAWMGFGALRAGLAILAKRKASASTNAGTNVDALSADVEGTASIAGGLGGAMSRRQGFLTGLYTNLLNPKALVFFLTLFSALITPSVTTSTKIASAVLLLSLSLAWFGFLAVMLSKAQVQLKLQRLTPIIDAIIGVIFMSVALAIYANLLLTA